MAEDRAAAYLAEVQVLIAQRDALVARAGGAAVNVQEFNPVQDKLAARTPALAAAVEAVLALCEDEDSDGNRRSPELEALAAEFRQAVSAALLGEEGSRGDSI